ncbi:hypothetical protein [Streptomyces sp. NPDC005438]|uniref:hypothetical protein n=1 Tax=Streptomyces sp. NPDC005438 TaxID=3156880 RepID=UPI0033A08DB8
MLPEHGATLDDELTALDALPLEELRRRMAIVTELTGTAASCSQVTRRYRLPGGTRYAWNDSGGTSLYVYVTDDGRALLVTFEADHQLNIGFGDEDHPYLRAMLQGVPSDLLRMTEVPGQDSGDRYPDLTLTDPDTGRRLLAATGVFWYDGQRWRHAAEGVLAACAWEGIEPTEEPTVAASVYLLGEEFTPDTYFTRWCDDPALSPERRDHLRDLVATAFRRHPR